MSPTTRFPDDFNWGVGTSAYQIEGSASTGGRGPSVWDTFCQQEGTVSNGDHGGTACDHVNRFREDVALLKQIGVGAYRFSISWSRVMPTGEGLVNEPGLAFYEQLVDELLLAGITPWVTLFHWDYPQALFEQSGEKGGWLNPKTVDWFAVYTRVIIERLSDRVSHWITLNEPQCFLSYGHGDGTNAPGLKLPLAEQLTAAHHALLAHGRAVQVIRERAKTPPTIGWAPVGVVKAPASPAQPDIEAAQKATMDVPTKSLWNNTWFNDPVFLGHYPKPGLRRFGKDVPEFTAADMEIIAQPVDFLGLNIYTAQHVKAGDPGDQPTPPGTPRTAFDWPVVEDSLYWGVRFHAQRYQVPIVITENGMANVDWVHTDGHVHDPQRIDYTRRHLKFLAKAIDEGFDVRGYFHWSLLDNFEWAFGYDKRFGLIHVDFETQQRTPKDSARWYAEVIGNNGF
ncbi:GH1 family beta-glucosidase [Adhaeretor mobilis]|nr:GH1 family beta-glucosidase [Adhaeretor mobilis]